MIEKAGKMLMAYVRWAKSGKPPRSPEYIAQLYRDHCEPCGARDGNWCTDCGCRLLGRGMKLTVPTENCPRGKFLADVSENPNPRTSPENSVYDAD